MLYNNHETKRGSHAMLSPSQHYFLSYDYEGLVKKWKANYASPRGTKLHELAEKLIKRKIKLNDTSGYHDLVLFYLLDEDHAPCVIPRELCDVEQIFPTLMLYVNDAIGFEMDPEIVLYFSDRVYGTVDAIYYGRNTLRIHDLKTGVTKASMDQLKIYAALFFLEYHKKVEKTAITLAIYQNGDIEEVIPDKDEILQIMEIIQKDDSLLKQIIEGEE